MIPLTTHGRPTAFDRPVVGRIARKPETDPARRASAILAIEDDFGEQPDTRHYRGILTTLSLERLSRQTAADIPIIHSAGNIGHLESGDIVTLFPRSGLVRTVFRPNSRHNFLFATQRCNSFCLMCSQPPVDRDDSEQVRINLETIRLIETPTTHVGITGGEPTLLGEGLFRILEELRGRLPETEIHMLTNGRRFAWPQYARAFSNSAHPLLTLCVPLYADNAVEHDYVVQARGAFDQTIQGLHALARYDQRVEIRVVLHKLTIPRLADLATFIYRNLPFAAHVALMGLEITGFTKPNLNKLWIDPHDYQTELARAVEYLSIRGMNVSIYNHPLCLLPEHLWSFAKRSISDWKNIYLGECDLCTLRQECGGFFKSAELRHSQHIKAMT